MLPVQPGTMPPEAPMTASWGSMSPPTLPPGSMFPTLPSDVGDEDDLEATLPVPYPQPNVMPHDAMQGKRPIPWIQQPTALPEGQAKTTFREFVVVVTRIPGDAVGMVLDWCDMEKLRITAVHDGVVANWNMNNPTLQVRECDYIIDVNGSRGDPKAMLDVINKATSLRMTIRTNEARHVYYTNEHAAALLERAASLPTYGIAGMKITTQNSIQPLKLVILLLAPVVVWTCTFYLIGFDLRYASSMMARILAFGFALPAVIFLGVAIVSPRDKSFTIVTSGSCLLAYILAYLWGDYNYQFFMRPYYQVRTLSTYPHVDPLIEGSQVMDAGMIGFEGGSQILTAYTMGIKNGDRYCVAPIGTNAIAVNGSARRQRLDFWAVGKNCCHGHGTGGFQCGEYSNPAAHWGLRELNDIDRNFYRIAVEQAVEAFNLKVSHPLFLTWLSDPKTEVQTYSDDGIKHFIMSIFICFSFQVLLVMVVATLLPKFGGFGSAV